MSTQSHGKNKSVFCMYKRVISTINHCFRRSLLHRKYRATRDQYIQLLMYLILKTQRFTVKYSYQVCWFVCLLGIKAKAVLMLNCKFLVHDSCLKFHPVHHGLPSIMEQWRHKLRNTAEFFLDKVLLFLYTCTLMTATTEPVTSCTAPKLSR